jgi:hypothetical protein
MERSGIEPVTSGLQSRAKGDDERGRSRMIAPNHAGLKRIADVGAASPLEVL